MTPITYFEAVEPLVLNNLTKRLHEMDVYPDDALDELTQLDPETQLGQAMSHVMIQIANLTLFDYYQGYDRVDDLIKIYLSGDAPADKMQALVDRIEMSVEGPVGDEVEENPILIKATLLRSSLNDKDFSWIIELRIFGGEPDENDVPVAVDMQGEVSADQGAKEIEEPTAPEEEEPE